VRSSEERSPLTRGTNHLRVYPSVKKINPTYKPGHKCVQARSYEFIFFLTLSGGILSYVKYFVGQTLSSALVPDHQAYGPVWEPNWGEIKVLDFHGTLFKLLNGAFRAKIFYMKVVLKYHINPFFRFVIIKTQLITSYYHLVLHKNLIFIFIFIFRRFKQSLSTLYHFLIAAKGAPCLCSTTPSLKKKTNPS
jgi:hypothetical protein